MLPGSTQTSRGPAVIALHAGGVEQTGRDGHLGCTVKNEMLCIGKGSNYDARVLVQASGRPYPGCVTSMRRGGLPIRRLGPHRLSALGRGMAARVCRCRSALYIAALYIAILRIFILHGVVAHRAILHRAVRSVSDEPARRVRQAAFLVRYRLVFAW